MPGLSGSRRIESGFHYWRGGCERGGGMRSREGRKEGGGNEEGRGEPGRQRGGRGEMRDER